MFNPPTTQIPYFKDHWNKEFCSNGVLYTLSMGVYAGYQEPIITFKHQTLNFQLKGFGEIEIKQENGPVYHKFKFGSNKSFTDLPEVFKSIILQAFTDVENYALSQNSNDIDVLSKAMIGSVQPLEVEDESIEIKQLENQLEYLKRKSISNE